MCNTLLCLRSNTAIQIQGLAPPLEVEKHDNRMCQYLAHTVVWGMPQIVGARMRPGKMLRQRGANGFDQLPPSSTNFSYGPRVCALHPGARRRAHRDGRAFR